MNTDEYLDESFFGSESIETKEYEDDDIYYVDDKAIREEDIGSILELVEKHTSDLIESALRHGKLHLLWMLPVDDDILLHSIENGNNRAFNYIFDIMFDTYGNGIAAYALDAAIQYNRKSMVIYIIRKKPVKYTYVALRMAYVYNNEDLFHSIQYMILFGGTEYRSKEICEMLDDAIVHRKKYMAKILYLLAHNKNDASCVTNERYNQVYELLNEN